MLCPVREGGRDVSREGDRVGDLDDGEWLNQDLMVDLDGKRRRFFLWPGASKCSGILTVV